MLSTCHGPCGGHKCNIVRKNCRLPSVHAAENPTHAGGRHAVDKKMQRQLPTPGVHSHHLHRQRAALAWLLLAQNSPRPLHSPRPLLQTHQLNHLMVGDCSACDMTDADSVTTTQCVVSILQASSLRKQAAALHLPASCRPACRLCKTAVVADNLNCITTAWLRIAAS